MCVANSARSQMAEGLAKSIFPAAEIQSAGSRPTKVNPLAIEVLKELGIDISGHSSKTVDSLEPEFLNKLDYVITLCAEEVCPVILTQAKKLHWPHPDPAGHNELSQLDQLIRFRSVRDDLARKLVAFKKGLDL